jgi:hypothetical protein
MIERHQDYILTLPSLPSGASALSVPLTLDFDAPFAVRGRGIHIPPPPNTRNQSGVNSLLFRYKNAAGNYLAPQAIQAPADFWNAFGQNGHYRPVWPQQPYPPGGTISVDVINNGPDITNLQVIFRGVKLFQPGSIAALTYPPDMTKRPPIDFTYQTGKGTPNDPAIVLSPSGAGSTVLQAPLRIQADADFVLRGLQAGLWTSSGDGGLYSTNGYTELYVQLFDAQLKPYSNVPIHIDWLFGNAGGSGLPTFTALGNAAPGLLVPEIYIPRNSALYFNLIRQDGPYVAFTDDLPVRLSMAWIGSKVYTQ